ncbi:MAG: HDIG domain-containing protein [Dysgonamonadaceae bacterium]|jgi:putative nucleotidyltransferase with HDIG domain|nr:HDIG domain-containing protein [Dysgonamonadaceae bacterium]
MVKKTFEIPAIAYFILVATVIIAFFPREGKFRYSFDEGKPWHYGLLTAPFDFPVYKTSAEIQAAKDSSLRNFQPYYSLDKSVETEQISRFEQLYDNIDHEIIPSVYKNYVISALRKIYARGTVSEAELQRLAGDKSAVIRISGSAKVETLPEKDLFTAKTAYDFMVSNCPPYLDFSLLSDYNLVDFLHENLKYDSLATEKERQAILAKIAPYVGTVQADEKIIDRGELVNSQTYNILRSLKMQYDKQGGETGRQIALLTGIAFLVCSLLLCFFLYLYFLRKKIYNRRKDVLFLLMLLVIFILLTEICVNYKLFDVYIIPFAIIPIVIRTFFDSRTAIMTHNITTLICALMLPLPFEFILMQFIVCLVVIYVLKDLTRRSELITCSFYILASYILVYLALLLLQDGGFARFEWNRLVIFLVNYLFVMFTYPFIYILEKIFGYISNVTLVELSDINKPILQKLAERCPGTFQHTLQVSMLGAAAASKIGANPQLIRTGALYHDLGKMNNPSFFVENKIAGEDPHQGLSLVESARIITRHVPDGVAIAEKEGIPQEIIKFIKTHHGRGKAKYFYNSFRNQFPDAEVDEKAFSYEGVNPDTKETAILMMADSVEAASHSLPDYSETSIRTLVDKIIDTQIADGLMKDAPLTFQNITAIKTVFVEKLISMYHSRISYPELKK